MAISGTDWLEVPTRYKAYVREYSPKIWPYMVQYLHFRILEFPLIWYGNINDPLYHNTINEYNSLMKGIFDHFCIPSGSWLGNTNQVPGPIALELARQFSLCHSQTSISLDSNGKGVADDFAAASFGCRKINTCSPKSKGWGRGTTLWTHLVQYKRTALPQSGQSLLSKLRASASQLNFSVSRKVRAAKAASQCVAMAALAWWAQLNKLEAKVQGLGARNITNIMGAKHLGTDTTIWYVWRIPILIHCVIQVYN